MKENRLLYIDMVKILSIFLVIVNHTNSNVFLSLSPSVTWFASLTYFYISKVAVPMFIMATGALLLGRTEGYKKHAQRLKRMFVVFLTFSIFYYIINNHFNVTYDNIKDMIISIIQKPSTNALWYMYLYIGISMALPFLQKMASVLNERDTILLIFLSLVVIGLVLSVEHILKINIYNGFNFIIYCYPIGYLFSGYYINKYQKINKIYFTMALLAFFSSVFTSVILSYHDYPYGYENFLFWSDIELLNISVSSVSAFYIIKYISIIPLIQKNNKYITNISMCTFGMYLASEFVLQKSVIFYLDISKYINQFFSYILFQIIVFFICFIIIFYARKLNFVKRYI